MLCPGITSVTEMLCAILNPSVEEFEDDDDDTVDDVELPDEVRELKALFFSG